MVILFHQLQYLILDYELINWLQGVYAILHVIQIILQ